MIYSDRLLSNPRYLDLLARIEKAEQERIFCGHDLDHFMAVARIGRIINCEDKLGLDPDDIYLAALLHDVGRLKEYEDGIPHDEAGVPIAASFLEEISYPEEERATILEAVSGHRSANEQDEDGLLTKLIRRADKLSRPCFSCPARAQCNWPESQKNKSFRY